MAGFKLVSPYTLRGDQPQAVAQLTAGLEAGLRHQVLLGVTGSGKTFTMANIVARINRPIGRRCSEGSGRWRGCATPRTRRSWRCPV